MLKQFITNLFTSSPDTDTTEKEGTVKFFNITKGFGFIKVNDTEEEIFVHKSNLIDRIRDNDSVTFRIEKEEKGLTAVDVRKVK
jgi:CspA family cold shock protein